MQKRYVQHISGQGQKWQVLDGHPPGLQNGFRPMDHHEWIVCTRVGSEQYYNRWFALPKSEYRLCEPPEEWEDVTEEYRYGVTDPRNWKVSDGDRVRFIDHLHNGPAFIVERKKSDRSHQ